MIALRFAMNTWWWIFRLCFFIFKKACITNYLRTITAFFWIYWNIQANYASNNLRYFIIVQVFFIFFFLFRFSLLLKQLIFQLYFLFVFFYSFIARLFLFLSNFAIIILRFSIINTSWQTFNINLRSSNFLKFSIDCWLW